MYRICGGPTQQQKDAATSQTNLNKQQFDESAKNNAITDPIFTQEAQGGLPFFQQESQYSTSDLGRQASIQQAQLKARNAGFGGALPSGFAESQNRDFAASTAENFDQNQMGLLQRNQAEKDQAAALLSGKGTQAAGIATQGNNAVMQAPLQNNFWGNLVQGIVAGGSQMGAAKLGA